MKNKKETHREKKRKQGERNISIFELMLFKERQRRKVGKP